MKVIIIQNSVIIIYFIDVHFNVRYILIKILNLSLFSNIYKTLYKN